jgi:hypothetical protein
LAETVSQNRLQIDVIHVNEDLVNVENSDNFNKYKPTTSTPEAEDSSDDRMSAYPTRPSRPTKPTVRWPTFHATSSHLTVTQSDDVTPDVTQRNSFVHFPQAATRPTKQPPPLDGFQLFYLKNLL